MDSCKTVFLILDTNYTKSFSGNPLSTISQKDIPFKYLSVFLEDDSELERIRKVHLSISLLLRSLRRMKNVLCREFLNIVLYILAIWRKRWKHAIRRRKEASHRSLDRNSGETPQGTSCSYRWGKILILKQSNYKDLISDS